MARPQYWAVLLFYVYVVNCSHVEEATTKSTEAEVGLNGNPERQVSILKRINRVNSDGSYTYGYEAADGSFKIETRDVAGNVKGVFGYVDETGRIKRVSYSTKNGTEYQSGHLIVPENETVSTLSSPINHQQIIRPQITPVASASTTTESQIQSRRPVFRPANPRTTTESTATSASKISDQVTRKLYPVYNANHHLSTKNKSFDEKTNSKLVSNRTMLRKELTNTSATDSTGYSSVTRRPVHTVYGQYIRQPFTHLHRMQNHSTVNNSKNESINTPLSMQAQLYEDLIQALDDTDDATLVLPMSSRSFDSRRNSEDFDRSDVSSLETDGSQSAIDHIYFRQTRRNSSGNGLRRQLTDINGDLSSPLAFPPSKSQVAATDDSLDVYGGSTPATTPRPIPSFAYRPYGVGVSKPRTIEDAILQNPYAATQGAVTDPTVPYVPEDTVQKAPPGRIPYGNFRPGDFRRIYVTQQDDYDGNYYYQQYDMRNLLAQLTQLLIYQLQQNYNTRLTPAQIALISMLGIDIPPGLVTNSYYPPPALIPRRQGYPQEQSPYSPGDDTLYVTNEDPRLFLRRRPAYRPRPQFVPPSPQPFPYDSRQAGRDDPRVPYTPTPGLQVLLPRYYPAQPLPYNSPEVQYSQGGRSSGRSSHVAMPQEILPDEYRDAVFLRMLLAARAQQAPTKGLPPQQFPAGAEPSPLPGYATSRPLRGQPEHSPPGTVLVRPRPVFGPQASGSSSSSTTTGRPRTLAPTRSVQILDPVTEEPTVKRSADNSTSTASAVPAS